MPFKVRTQILIWLCALTAIAYLQRSLGVAESTLRTQAGFDKDEMGLLQSSFLWSYAIFQIPTGWLCQRWGPRFGLSLFCLTWSVATGLTGLTTNLWILCLTRFLVGLGQAAALPAVAEIMATWFPTTVRGTATAWVTAFMQVGALLNAFATGWLLEQHSLASYFYLLAAPGVVWAIGFYFWYRDRPESFTGLSPAEQADLPAVPSSRDSKEQLDWSRLLLSKVLWFISAQQFFRAAGYIFFATWFPTYMQEARHYDIKKSGLATGCALAGVLIGNLVGGTISDWIYCRTGSVRLARQGIAVISLLLCAACIVAFFQIRGDSPAVNVVAVGLMTIGTFWSGVAGPSGYTVTIDISGKHVATVFGCMNMAGNAGAGVFALIVPYLLGPQRNQWDLVIILFALLYVAAALFWMLLDPRQQIFDDKTGTDSLPAT